MNFSYYRIQASDFIKAPDYQNYLMNTLEPDISLLCPEDLFWTGGPVFWQIKESKAQAAFSKKSITLWGEVGAKGGYALGALRMGFRHLIVSDSRELFRQLQDCAKFYQAQIRYHPSSY